MAFQHPQNERTSQVRCEWSRGTAGKPFHLQETCKVHMKTLDAMRLSECHAEPLGGLCGMVGLSAANAHH